ncbi:MAG TPA: S-methyl-5-thioribose-1-phosphate isomerase [Polyangia bacterium]|jgi:S-methyl-5-thioribose-1-phosphate isomerase|nr:S-methyl-5-thioribose-1-phosphate isomerase [Polyangia bacterium]
MNVAGVPYRTIRLHADASSVEVIDQTVLPHEFRLVRLHTLQDAVRAIADMVVRGAPLIGATAAYGMALALRQDASDTGLARAHAQLLATRPTAVNLRWALDDIHTATAGLPPAERAATAYRRAAQICDEDVALCSAIGEHGQRIIEAIAKRKGSSPVNVLTHCNAGWLATVDWGTALAPVYKAHDAGIAVHVWVEETRPRNQGASLTAWELGQHGVPHHVIVDNAGGHFMQHGAVDVCFVGTDRTTATGDVCNKIGTYLKALAARDCQLPFYVCLPSPSIDWTIQDGVAEIPIEERGADEVRLVRGLGPEGKPTSVLVTPQNSPVANPGFDVTPARLVSGLVTERGVCAASANGLAQLFPERAGRR